MNAQRQPNNLSPSSRPASDPAVVVRCSPGADGLRRSLSEREGLSLQSEREGVPLQIPATARVALRTTVLLAAAALAAVQSRLFAAEELTADQIANKASLVSYYAGKDGRARVLMKIYDAQGRTRSRMMTILRYDIADGGEQRYYVYFHRPADVQRMVYMVWKHPGQDDDRWLYMPALDLVKRIAAGDKRTSFVGSHFLYEDVSGRGVEEDTHELMPGDAKHYVLKNVPKDPSSVEFSYYIVWIDKQTFMPMKAEYYDKTGKKYRIVEAVKVETIQGHPTVTQSKATDLNSGGYTLMRFGRIVYDTGMPVSIFQERYLRRPPVKWLK